MQSFREQSSYHGNQQSYQQDVHGSSRLEEFGQHPQTQMFQSYTNRRTSAAGMVADGYFRKEAGEYYYLGSKDGSAQQGQRRPSGTIQSYGPPQGTAFGSQFASEGQVSQYTAQHSTVGGISHFQPDHYPGPFSPGSSQYQQQQQATAQQHVQPIRHSPYQSHPPLQQPAGQSTTSTHLQQLQRSSASYQHRLAQFGQHYQASSTSSAYSSPQRFNQSGQNYEGYSLATNSQYDSHIAGSNTQSYGTPSSFGYQSQHVKTYEQSKLPQGQQHSQHAIQYSNPAKISVPSQVAQYGQAEVPVKSPMQFHQNFSPISNPSPAASVVQSPSCSSTPSPLMPGGENLQCGQGSLPVGARNRILQMMPQLSPTPTMMPSPNPHGSSYKGYGLEGLPEKRMTDPGLNSLSALSSQVANIPNTVQHMLLSDTIVRQKKSSKRSTKKVDSSTNSEASSQAEEHLKSPRAESLDGGCSSSSEDHVERMRQLSGQSTCSETTFKGAALEKTSSSSPPEAQSEPCKVNPSTAAKDDSTAQEKKDSSKSDAPKVNEKSVGVIVSREAMVVRAEKPAVGDRAAQESAAAVQTSSIISGVKVPALVPQSEQQDQSTASNVATNSISHNGEGVTQPSHTVLTSSFSGRPDASKTSGSLGYGYRDNTMGTTSRALGGAFHSSQYLTGFTNHEKSDFVGQTERRPTPGRADKVPSLLQEVLQGYHHPDRRYARSIPDAAGMSGSLEGSMRPNVLVNQAADSFAKNVSNKNIGALMENPHWGQWDKKLPNTSEVKQINVADYSTPRKLEVEQHSVMHESSVNMSERRSVICDVSPSRPLVRDPSSYSMGHINAPPQDRGPDNRTGRSEWESALLGQSVILAGGQAATESKVRSQMGAMKTENVEQSKPRGSLNSKNIGEPAPCPTHIKSDSTKTESTLSLVVGLPSFEAAADYCQQDCRSVKRAGAREGGKVKFPSKMQDFGEKLKTSPARAGDSAAHQHLTPQGNPPERANMRSPYAYPQNSESQALVRAYQMNLRPANFSEPSLSMPLNSPLHYKKQMYQQEDHKEWISGSMQRVISAVQARQEFLSKSPRQDPFHERVWSPLRSEKDTAMYNQTTTFHDPAKHEMGMPIMANEASDQNFSGESKLYAQQGAQQGTGWALSCPVSPSRGSDFQKAVNQLRASPRHEADVQSRVMEDPTHLIKMGNNVPRIAGQEDQSHQNPLIMRRRVRSFISPIPAKRQIQDTKTSNVEEKTHILLQAKDAIDMTSNSSIPESQALEASDLSPKGATTKETGSPDEKSSAAMSLTSPAKTKILPPRKGRGLKLEAIVQKITSPNVRKISSSISAESGTDSVTLDEILSLKSAQFENSSLPVPASELKNKMVSELTIDTKPPVCPEFDNDGSLPEGKYSRAEEKTKKEMTCDVAVVHKDHFGCTTQACLPKGGQGRPEGSLSAVGSLSTSDFKRLLSPPRLPHHDPQSVSKELDGGPLRIIPKQEGVPKGYFPSGKKKGRPVGSVNKQKRQQPEGAEDAEPKQKRRRGERRKPAPRQRRRRRSKQIRLVVEPNEPEIKLKYATQPAEKVELKNKSFFPYIHVETKNDIGAVCTIVNLEEEEQNKQLKGKKALQRSSSPPPSTDTKVLPTSSYVLQGPAVTESSVVGRLVCCLCGKWANYRSLGDLFGPYYPHDYIATLPKNPPPKKTTETQGRVKVRHKSLSDGSKTDSEDEPKEQRSLPAHPRFKRRHRSEDLGSPRSIARGALCRKPPSDTCGKSPTDSNPQAPPTEVSSEVGLQIPELPLDSNEFWVHEACILWANGVYLVCGKLYGLQEAVEVAREMRCSYCQEIGATLGCFSKGCSFRYHYPCAKEAECFLSEENFSMRCRKHKVRKVSIL
uniref:Transcription factor 20 n=1 Tax=Latimeria chalumnae TaxID=7897 RepID=H2ZXL0_LATCH